MGPKRKTLSQPTTSTKAKSARISSSQPNINDSFRNLALTTADLKDQANDCVRYMIYRSGLQLPFRRSDIQKQITNSGGRTMDKILEKASTILEKVYGYKLILCDGSTKFFILSNILPHIGDLEEEEPDKLPDDRNKILLMLVLVHLFMSPTTVTQASLYSFLKEFEIDPERRHELFGNVKEYLTTTLVKQHYLQIDKDSITQDLTFSWGARAEKEISKHEILKFVCKIFKDTTPQQWLTQHEKAEKQPLENHRNEQQDGGEGSEDDEE